MQVWVVSQFLQWEGEFIQGILSDEGLDRYLSTRPAFKPDGYGGYATDRVGDEWFGISPQVVDSLNLG